MFYAPNVLGKKVRATCGRSSNVGRRRTGAERGSRHGARGQDEILGATTIAPERSGLRGTGCGAQC